jgi:hypothetical protein
MEEVNNSIKSEPSQVEMAKLENALLQAEYRYGKDIAKLQQALIRARKMGTLSFIGIHLRLIFLEELSKTIPVENALYKWKSKCVTDNATRNKRVKKILYSIYKTIITRAFYVFKERRFKRSLSEKPVEGPSYAQGALSPLSSEDDDLEI